MAGSCSCPCPSAHNWDNKGKFLISCPGNDFAKCFHGSSMEHNWGICRTDILWAFGFLWNRRIRRSLCCNNSKDHSLSWDDCGRAHCVCCRAHNRVSNFQIKRALFCDCHICDRGSFQSSIYDLGYCRGRNRPGLPYSQRWMAKFYLVKNKSGVLLRCPYSLCAYLQYRANHGACKIRILSQSDSRRPGDSRILRSQFSAL